MLPQTHQNAGVLCTGGRAARFKTEVSQTFSAINTFCAVPGDHFLALPHRVPHNKRASPHTLHFLVPRFWDRLSRSTLDLMLSAWPW